jgi:hypothetical protein
MEHYPTIQDAFGSLNIDKITKFSKRNANKIVRKLCKILLKHKYENDRRYSYSYWEGISESWAIEQNWSDEKKEKEMNRMKKNKEKAIAEQIKSDMRGWNEWSFTSFDSCSNDGPLEFAGESLRYAINENEDFVMYTDCYNYSPEKMENIIEITKKNNIELIPFIKKFPDGLHPHTERKWKISNNEYKGHYGDNNWQRSFHRGTLVGFIVKVTYDMFN